MKNLRQIKIGFFLLLNIYASIVFGKFAIIQGATSFESTQVAVLTNKNSKYRYQLRDRQNQIYLPVEVSRKERSHSSITVDQVYFRALPAGEVFELKIFDQPGHDETLLDQRSLKTFSRNQTDVKIALASCMSDLPIFDTQTIWSSLVQQKPDVVFFLGDNVYAAFKNAVNPEKLWDRYVETRSLLGFFYQENLIPVFATWDDHDFGQNNGDSSYPYVSESQKVFNDFFPQQPLDTLLQKGPGVSQSLNLFNQQFVFLDSRSFRDQPHSEGSMWGLQQEIWLNDQINSTTQPIWLINGSQFFGKFGPSESLERDYVKHFERFQSMISATDRIMNFLSGDIHYSEVMQFEVSDLQRNRVEITSSSMHSFHSPVGSIKDNPRRLAVYNGDNFVIVNFNTKSKSGDLRVESFNATNENVFSIDIRGRAPTKSFAERDTFKNTY
jgi:alkaline phosphatase D